MWETSINELPQWLPATWSAPAHIKAFSTTVQGGVSTLPYGTLNLARHVGDSHLAVSTNRARVERYAQLFGEPFWLNQTHSSKVVIVDAMTPIAPEADASYTKDLNRPLVILTADCVPILLCDSKGQEIAAVHAGWRGLQQGIIAATITQFSAPPNTILAWIGPCIQQANYEVGPEVYDAFVSGDATLQSAFCASTRKGHFLCDLPRLASIALEQAGVQAIYNSGICTFSDERFFSYRRMPTTGRFGTFICIRSSDNSQPRDDNNQTVG